MGGATQSNDTEIKTKQSKEYLRICLLRLARIWYRETKFIQLSRSTSWNLNTSQYTKYPVYFFQTKYWTFNFQPLSKVVWFIWLAELTTCHLAKEKEQLHHQRAMHPEAPSDGLQWLLRLTQISRSGVGPSDEAQKQDRGQTNGRGAFMMSLMSKSQ